MKKRISCFTAVTMALIMAIIYVMPTITFAQTPGTLAGGKAYLEDTSFEYILTYTPSTNTISYTSNNPVDPSGSYNPEGFDRFCCYDYTFYNTLAGYIAVYVGDDYVYDMDDDWGIDIDPKYIMSVFFSFDENYPITDYFDPYLVMNYSDDYFASHTSASIKFTYTYDSNDPRITLTAYNPPAPSPAPQGGGQYYDNLMSALNNTASGTIKWDAGDSLPQEAMEALVNNPNLSLEFTFTYEGQEYTVFIPAGAMAKLYDPSIPWYGPAWLLKYFGSTTPGTGNVYVVQLNDTLGLIAAKFNTTVEALMALNPEITNPNLIYEGQKIKY